MMEQEERNLEELSRTGIGDTGANTGRLHANLSGRNGIAGFCEGSGAARRRRAEEKGNTEKESNRCRSVWGEPISRRRRADSIRAEEACGQLQGSGRFH